MKIPKEVPKKGFIKGTPYNLDKSKSECIVSYAFLRSSDKEEHFDESLYRSPPGKWGKFFLVGSGGKKTKWDGKGKVFKLTDEMARDWCVRRGFAVPLDLRKLKEEK